jgi:hypothetical protein
MNDDNHVRQSLGRLTPRGSGSELRGQVLAAVGRELSTDPVSRWQRRIGLVVAASLLLGVVLNVWVNTSATRRQARLYGPRPVPRRIAEVAEAVASVTDAETGRRLEQQLTAVWRARVAELPQRPIDYSQLLRELKLFRKDRSHEDLIQEDAEMDRDRRRLTPGDTSDCQWDLGLEDRLTA